MAHFIAYNKVEDWGEYRVGGTEFYHYSGHPLSKLEKTIGQTVWVISGEKINRRMIYTLCSVYTPDRVKKLSKGGFSVCGNGIGFNPHILLKKSSWLDALLKEQRNFSFGLNEIRNPKVIQAPEQIRNNQDIDFTLPDEAKIPQKHFEGAVKQITVNAYERNPQARADCIAHYGAVCDICGFDFSEQYGEIGKGYIHVHHLKPLAKIGEKYQVNPVKDLKPVCPNCHAMLHSKEPPYTINQIQKLVRRRFDAL